MTDEFCKGCGIKLQTGGGVAAVSGLLFGGGPKNYEFEEGSYCQKCAKIRVEKGRKKL